MFDRHAGKRTFVTFIGGSMGVALIATLVIAAVVVFITIGAPVWNSWSAHKARIQQEENRAARVEQAAQEDSFEVVCPDYFQASFLERWFGGYRRLSWCEDYRDRVPEPS